MAKCPQCNANLGPSDLLALKCLSCGGSIAALPELDPAGALRTLDENTSPLAPTSFGRTIDEQAETLVPGELPLAPLGGATIQETPTLGEQGFGQTLASGEFQLPSQDIPETGTVKDAGQTLQSLDIAGASPTDVASKGTGSVHETFDSGSFPPIAPPSPENQSTMPEARVEQTLDSGNFPSIPAGEGGGTVHETRGEQTLDSGDFPTPPPKGPGTVHDVSPGNTLLDGAAGSAGEKTGGTVFDRRVDQTLDSADLASAEQSEARKTVDERHPAQTIDSVGSELSAGQPKTVSQRQHAATLDSGSLGLADLEKVSQVWEGSFTGRDTPMTSIKAKAPPTEIPENTLNVALRVFRGAGVKTSKPADYDLLKQLGEGGMGIVYKARQASIDRTVAIKTLKPKTAKDKQQRDKFLAEAVVTGELDHPNIVPIYDLGANEEGALFYSMKMVQGTPWMDEIKKKSLHANIEILMKVADAIAFAHSRDVVHRDLKPENIMLGGFGEVLVMDWGLAIYTIRSKRPGGIKQSVSMGGTPAYMAPEMAAGPFEKIGPASDVYLLGAMLYEIVTGKPPHTGQDVMKCLFAAAKNQIQSTEVKSELVEIALKAMSTKIEERYSTVQIFQDAIREYLSHSESIVLSTRADEDLQRARKTNDYQDFAQARFGFQKALEMWSGNGRARLGLSEANLAYATSALAKGDFDLGLSLLDLEDPQHEALVTQLKAAQHEREARQHRLKTMRRAMIAGVGVFVVTVLGALGIVTFLGLEANKQKVLAVAAGQKAIDEKKAADIAKDDALEQKKAADIAKNEAIEQRKAADTATMLAKMATNDAIEEKKKADVARDDAKVAEGKAVDEKKAAEYQEYIAVIGLAAAKIDENAHDRAKVMLKKYEDQPDLINWEWGRLMRLCNQSIKDFPAADKLETVAFDSSGKRIVAGGWSGKAYIWNIGDKKAIEISAEGSTRVTAVAFSPTQDVVATGSDDDRGYIRLWSASTGKPLVMDAKDFGFVGHKAPVLSLSFTKDGKRLLSSSADGYARLWNVETRKPIREYRGHVDPVQNAVFSPKEDRFVTVSDDGTALVWDVETGTKGHPFYGHEGPVYAAAFSPDGVRIATGGYDKRVLIWEADKVKAFDYKKHGEEFRKQQKNKGEDKGTAEGDLVKFKISLDQKISELAGHTDRVQSVRFSADGKFLFSAGHDNLIRVWDANRAWTEGSKSLLKTLRGHGSPVRSCAISSDGLVLSGSYDTTAKLWDVRKYEEVRVLLGKGPRHSEEVLAASFSGEEGGVNKDNLRIITASQDRTAKIWRLAEAGGEASLIEERAFVEEREFTEGHKFLASAALFFSGGKRLLTCGVDQSARIWDVDSGTELRKLDRTGGTAVVAVSPDDKWILTGGDILKKEGDKVVHTVRLWEAGADKPPKVLEFHEGEVTVVMFSPDGTRFFTGDKNGRGRLWDATQPTPTPIGEDMRSHAAAIVGAAFLPGGKKLLTASGDNHVAHWDLSAETAVRVPGLTMAHAKGVKAMAVTKDGRFAVTSCEDGLVRLWDVAQPAKPARTFFVTIKVQKGGKEVDANGSVGSVAFSRDDKRAIFVADDDRSVRTFAVDPVAKDPAEMLLGLADSGEAYVRSAVFAPGDKGVLTVGGNEAWLWSIAALPKPGQRATETMRYSPHGVVATASFSPDRKRIVTASWDFTARIWNVETKRDELQLKGHTDQVNSALFSPDGKLVLTSSNDGTARVWDAANGRELRRYNVLKGKPDDKESGVRWASFSQGAGERVVTASSDNLARIWDSTFPADLTEVKQAESVDKPLGMLVGHTAAVLHAVFSPDGKRIVTGSKDNNARIWTTVDLPDDKDPKKSKKAWDGLYVLAGHTGGVNSVTFSPDSKRVLTGSDDFTAKLWDGDKGQEVLTLKGHAREITSVAFSSDGLYALTGSRDNKAIVWTSNDWKDAIAKPPVEAAAFRGR